MVVGINIGKEVGKMMTGILIKSGRRDSKNLENQEVSLVVRGGLLILVSSQKLQGMLLRTPILVYVFLILLSVVVTQFFST